MALSPDADADRLTCRRVYYLAGFDTRSARTYHQLYRDEARRQESVNGCRHEVGELQASGPHAWTWVVRRTDDGAAVETHYTFLAWNDVVHAHWARSTLRLACSTASVYASLFGNGLIAATRRLSRPFFWMLLLPLLYTVFALLLALLGGWCGGLLASLAGPAMALRMAGIAVGAGIGLALGLWLAEHQRVYWLLRAWGFMLAWARGQVPELAPRWESFARRIEDDRLAQPDAETLIVGHSAGAMSAVAVAERWLALQPAEAADRRVKLMTIGSATPLLGLIPEAGWFRTQLRQVGASGMPWIDFTAPADPLCYALVDPFRACGVGDIATPGYRVRSARFDRMFAPATYARARRDFFRIHFQYLCATDHAVANDYFTLTAGPQPLRVDPLS